MPDRAAKAMPKLILASRSPRRRELLQQAGYQFEVCAPAETAEGGLCSGESPADLVARLAYQKAADVAGRVSEGWILGCDTVVECDGQILGKPADRQHARQMLGTLSGRLHRVLTGLCLWKVPGRPKAGPRGRHHAPHGRPLHGATRRVSGRRAMGGKGRRLRLPGPLGWVHVLQGSESNVVGLPLELLAEMLG